MTDRVPSGKTRTDPAPQRTDGPQAASHGAPPTPSAAALHSLQQTAGNAAVGSLLASGEGGPLPPRLRQEMEERFGHDFSSVRVHDGPRGAEAADLAAAKALTYGRHVAFAQGRFAPDTSDGKRLIAHELAHVVQQSRGGSAQPTLDGNGPLEAGASDAAHAAVSGSGPIAVAGSSAVGPAADPEEKSWWQRQHEQLSSAATAAKEAYDDPEAALMKAEAKTGAIYDENAGKARAKAVEVKEAWDKSDAKKFAVEQIEQKSLDEQLADLAQLGLPPESDLSPEAQMTRSGAQLLKANAQLKAAPMRAALRALVEGHPIQAVEDWQSAADQGLKDMKTATFSAIDKWEDGTFDPRIQTSIDPAAHPTLSKIERGLDAAGKAVSSRLRQVPGGVAKALYSMVEGLDNIVVHPLNTAEALDKIVDMGSPLPSRDTLAEAAGFTRDLSNRKIKTGEAFKRLYQAEQDKQAARQKTRIELLKGIGHNYVEAAGGEFVPPAKEQTEDQKKRLAGMKEGEINWKGWSKRERIGEIPGLLLVDIGSFFLGGGEANAVTKTARAASVTGKLGDTAKVLGTLGEGSGDLGKLGQGAGDVGKVVEGTSDAGKTVEGTADASKSAAPDADATKAGAGANDAANATEAKATEPKRAGDPAPTGETKSPTEPAPADQPKTPTDPSEPGPQEQSPGPAEPPKGPPKEPPKSAKPKGSGNKPRPRKPDVNATEMKRKLKYAREARDQAKAAKKGLTKGSNEWKAADIRQKAANKAIREIRSGINASKKYRADLAKWERANPGKAPPAKPLEQSGYSPRASERAMTKSEFGAAQRDARSITPGEFGAQVDKELGALEGDRPAATAEVTTPDASGKAPASVGTAADALDFTKSAETVVSEAMQEAGIKKGASVSGGAARKVGLDLHRRIEAKWAQRPELKGIKPQAETKVGDLLPPNHPARGQSVRQFLEGRGDKALIEKLPDSVLKSKMENLQLDLFARMPDGSLLVWDLTSKEQIAHLAKTMLYSRIFEKSGVLMRVGETFWRKF